jgi:hypothetical protein
MAMDPGDPRVWIASFAEPQHHPELIPIAST